MTLSLKETPVLPMTVPQRHIPTGKAVAAVTS